MHVYAFGARRHAAHIYAYKGRAAGPGLLPRLGSRFLVTGYSSCFLWAPINYDIYSNFYMPWRPVVDYTTHHNRTLITTQFVHNPTANYSHCDFGCGRRGRVML
jgi:hypothetical protein